MGKRWGGGERGGGRDCFSSKPGGGGATTKIKDTDPNKQLQTPPDLKIHGAEKNKLIYCGITCKSALHQFLRKIT